jgi:hypothetical protein
MVKIKEIKMTKKYFYTLALILFVSTFVFSQKKTDTLNVKGLSQADMERIFGDLYKPGKVFKTAGDSRSIKQVIISGNKITTVVFNYGSICKPNYLSQTADLVWNGLGYGFEFGPLAAGEVLNANAKGGYDTLHIVDDSFVLTTQGSYNSDGTLKWGWLPKTGYADPNQSAIATLNAKDADGDGKPDSWPERWYSSGAGKYVWPSFLGDQATAPDEEVYFVMDDYTNARFPYYPFSNDSTKQGLGLDCEVRMFQFNNALAENILFLMYQITNASEKTIPKIYFGMQGDPHVGGYTDYSDDLASFIPPLGDLAVGYPQRARSMVYAWDSDGKGIGGVAPGYFGWKFLESPTNSTDGKDNDDDGIIDESPYNSAGNYIDGVSYPLTYGISDVAKYTALYGAPKARYMGDENGNWDPAKDDVGIDGIGPDSKSYPGPDYGEGDGKPSQAWYYDVNGDNKYEAGEPISDEKLPGYKWAGSEPNFGVRDVAESDQIGLSSFHAAAYGSPNYPNNYTLMWEWLSSDSIDPNQTLLKTAGDNIFNFGTGPMVLTSGELQRFSMAILFGKDLSDLLLAAETSSQVLEANYQFAQPPVKPIVKAVAGDGRVTLYWDTRSEASVDPLTRAKDFEGYKIYRSRDYTFSDVYTITDGNGVAFLGQALLDPNTGKRAQFDLVDSLSGYHPVEYAGRAVKYYLGSNTGLVHQYVDSTVKNGINYYYAVVAYDGGNEAVGKEMPPSETQAVIQKDAITGKLTFDVNTVSVTPNALPAGLKSAAIGVAGEPILTKGASTGTVKFSVLDNLSVQEKTYKLSFADSVTYNVLDSLGVTENIISKDTTFVSLANANIQSGSFQLYDVNNNLVSSDKYFVNYTDGKVRGLAYNNLPTNQVFKAKYRFYTVAGSKLLNNEDGNPTFCGIKVFVKNDVLAIDTAGSGYTKNSKTNTIAKIVTTPETGINHKNYRASYEVRWNDLDTTATGMWAHPGDTVNSHIAAAKKVVCPFTVVDITDGEKANYIIFEAKNKNSGKWDFSKAIIILPQNLTTKDNVTSYEIKFTPLPDSLGVSVLPSSGDVYVLKTFKPFAKGDEYVINATPVKYEAAAAKTKLDNIYCVPNPYVAYSISENPGRTSDVRGSKDLQFRNLPPKCTIRIFTLTGELVQTIYKDDLTSIASWDLLSNEGQRVSYGVYIYHVDMPGVGSKIGRIAIIK